MKPAIKAKKAESTSAFQWIISIGILLLWAVAIGIISLYYAARLFGFELFYSYFDNAKIVYLNLLPALFLALLLFAATNRIWPGILGSGAIILIGSLVGYFKIQARSEPLLASDLKYLGEAANMTGKYTFTLTPTMIICLIAVVGVTVLAAYFLKARFYRIWPRLLVLFLVLGFGAYAYFAWYRSEDVYQKTENLDVELYHGHELNEWNETDQYVCRGFWYPFLYSTTDLGVKKPDGYSVEKAKELLDSYDSADIPEGKKVNIISIMLEAYTDLTDFPQLEFENDPYSFFHALEKKSISGDLDTNIFAGGTIDTERCYISASPEMYDYRVPADSYARWFAGQGYYTEFCHPGLSWFYNRKNVSEYLGFDQSLFGDDYFTIPEGVNVILDQDFFPQLLNRFYMATATGQPYFNFTVTYQNHGPYATDSLYDEGLEFVRQGNMTEESYIIINNYLWGINRTDEALRELVENLDSNSQPVVLVLFGDHKPWLGDNSTAYDDAGIDITWWENESYYNYCRTPYVIWANDAAKEMLGMDFQGDGGDFSPCFLMMKLFDACGYTGDQYMNALRDTYSEVDIVSPRLRRYRTGEDLVISPDYLPETAKEKVYKLETLSYYRMKHALR